MTSQHEMNTAARATALAAQRTVEAKAAGMPETSARRWPRYLAMCEAQGRQPISLDEAVVQVLDARLTARLRELLRTPLDGPMMRGEVAP